MVITVVVLSLALTYTAFRLILLRRGVRHAARQLRAYNTGRVLAAAPDSALEELLKELNRLLDRMQEAERAYRQKDLLFRQQIANISHDLRTPLTSISGYIQLLAGHTCSDAERLDYIAIIQKRAQGLETLIADFYELSRLESGEYPLNPEPVMLNAVLSEQLAAYYGLLKEQGLKIQTELENGLPPIWADKTGVGRIFSNLIGNAIKHGSGRLSIRQYLNGSRVITVFSNPAPSLSDEDAQRLFERSFTGDKTRSGRNTGLGLAIVKALAEKMGHSASARMESGILIIEVAWRLNMVI